MMSRKDMAQPDFAYRSSIMASGPWNPSRRWDIPRCHIFDERLSTNTLAVPSPRLQSMEDSIMSSINHQGKTSNMPWEFEPLLTNAKRQLFNEFIQSGQRRTRERKRISDPDRVCICRSPELRGPSLVRLIWPLPKHRHSSLGYARKIFAN